jgi:flagellin
MRINQNIMAFNAYRNLSTTHAAMGKSLEKLSSGFRINRAADDAAGLVISEPASTDVRPQGATATPRTASLVVQPLKARWNEVHNLLNRMRDLAMRSSNAGSRLRRPQRHGAGSHQAISEIGRIAETTRFATCRCSAATPVCSRSAPTPIRTARSTSTSAR